MLAGRLSIFSLSFSNKRKRYLLSPICNHRNAQKPHAESLIQLYPPNFKIPIFQHQCVAAMTAEIQSSSSRRRVLMLSVFRHSSHFTHMQEQISHSLSLSLLKTANLRAAEHNPFPLMSEEKTWWMTVKEREKAEKPFGAPQDQKYSKHIRKPVMWWVTLAYWRSEGEGTLGGWIRAAHPTVEGGQERERKKSLKLAEEIIVRAKTHTGEEKRSNGGLSRKMWDCCWQPFLSFFSSSFSPGYILFQRV